MFDDDMSDMNNWTLTMAAKAAIAGNDGDAADFLNKVKEALDKITPEELQAKIDEVKSQKEEMGEPHEHSHQETGENSEPMDKSSEDDDNSGENS